MATHHKSKTPNHDCKAEKCVPHECKPAASSTARQVHSIISGALNAAVRWDWLASNPAKVARRPKLKASEPKPPPPPATCDEAARLINKAFELNEDWGKLVWLVMTTGMHRAEVAALHWRNIDLDAETVALLRAHHERAKRHCEELETD